MENRGGEYRPAEKLVSAHLEGAGGTGPRPNRQHAENEATSRRAKAQGLRDLPRQSRRCHDLLRAIRVCHSFAPVQPSRAFSRPYRIQLRQTDDRPQADFDSRSSSLRVTTISISIPTMALFLRFNIGRWSIGDRPGLRAGRFARCARFAEVRPQERLALVHVMDFVPGVKPSDRCAVDLFRQRPTRLEPSVALLLVRRRRECCPHRCHRIRVHSNGTATPARCGITLTV